MIESTLESQLEERGHALWRSLLSPQQCRQVVSSYERDELFRKTIVMENHAYGSGEYRYFEAPLPALIQDLRSSLYARLAPVANRWHEQLALDVRFPMTLLEFQKECHSAGQTRSTPLLLRYQAGDFNRLHQDLYGPLVFPIQVTILLSMPGSDFTGGEFLLTEHRARMQTKAEVIPLELGDAVCFAVRQRPANGVRGPVRVQIRHGVSRIRSGLRHALGIIFHDAA